MSAIKAAIVRQFGHPTGAAGWLVGGLMARKNRARIDWVMDHLPLAPEVRVLEVGMGPGVSCRRLLIREPRAAMTAVDHSALMVARCRRRNARACAAGQLRVMEGAWPEAVESIPLASFDIAFCINCHFFWPDPAAGLRAMVDRLATDGTLAVTLQPHWARDDREARREGARLRAQVEDAAGEAATLHAQRFRGAWCFLATAVLAGRPASAHE